MAMDLILPKIYPAMLDILKIIKNMDKEKRFGLIRIAMRDNTVIIYNMDQAHTFGKVEMFTKDNGSQEVFMEKESLLFKMEYFTMEIGLMEKDKDLEYREIKTTCSMKGISIKIRNMEKVS